MLAIACTLIINSSTADYSPHPFYVLFDGFPI